jgi:DNA-binding MarR family transcriptional regulator
VRRRATGPGWSKHSSGQYAHYMMKELPDEVTALPTAPAAPSAPASPTAVLDRVFELTVRLAGAMQQDQAARGLTRARATLLMALHRFGPLTQRQLSDLLRVTPRNVTGLVDALEAGGLVARGPHPADRRAALVGFTATGRSAAASLDEARQRFAGFLFDEVPADDLARFAGVLDHVLARLPGPDFRRIREQAIRGYRQATAGERDDQGMGRP